MESVVNEMVIGLPSARNACVDVITTFEEFQSLRNEWNELLAVAVNPSIYLSHTWLTLAWQRRTRRHDGLRVILVREGGKLAMAGAFVLTTRADRPIVAFLTSGLPQWEDVLWSSTDRTTVQSDALLTQLRRESGNHRELFTKRLPATSVFRRALKRNGLPRRFNNRSTWASLSLDAFRTIEDFTSTLSKNLIHDHQRVTRRLQESGCVFHDEHGAAKEEALKWLFEKKRAWLQEHGISSSSFERHRVDWFIANLNGLANQSVLVSTLRSQTRIIASSLSFGERDATNFRVIAHEPEFEKFSPGRSLSLHLVGQAIGAGHSRFEFGIGPSQLKDRLGVKYMPLLSEWTSL